MMICDADFDELFAPQDQVTQPARSAEIAPHAVIPPFLVQPMVAQSALLAAAVYGATWSMVAMSRPR
jgi:hypothetical protein